MAFLFVYFASKVAFYSVNLIGPRDTYLAGNKCYTCLPRKSLSGCSDYFAGALALSNTRCSQYYYSELDLNAHWHFLIPSM